MEQYSLEKALEESEKIRRQVFETKNQQGNIGETESGDYENANQAIEQKKQSGIVQIKDVFSSNPRLSRLREIVGISNPFSAFFKFFGKQLKEGGCGEQEYDREMKKWQDEGGWEKIKREINEEFGVTHPLDANILYDEERQKEFSLGVKSLYKILHEYCEFYKTETNRNIAGMYLPIIAIARRFLGDNMKGKTIVEIGSDRAGFPILKYFASLGANVVAIDISHPGKDILERFPEVKFIKGEWESMGKYFNSNQIDFIYTHYMHPHPESGGKFNGQQEGFISHIQKEMDGVLKSGGLYVHHSIETDFTMRDEEFEKMGYEILTLHPERIKRDSDIPEEIKQAFFPNASGREFSLGRYMNLAQKPLDRKSHPHP